MAGPIPPPAGRAEGQPPIGQPGPIRTPIAVPPTTRDRLMAGPLFRTLYPEALPPPVGYPPTPDGRAGRRPLWWALAGLAAVALVVAAVIVGGKRTGRQTSLTPLPRPRSRTTSPPCRTRTPETIARNTACGMFEAIKDPKSDLALARLASDAFRRQFSRAEVTSIDKIVLSSSYQAQVLFTMRVAPASGARNARDEQQGVAQLLRQDDQLLVCSYLLRTAAQY